MGSRVETRRLSAICTRSGGSTCTAPPELVVAYFKPRAFDAAAQLLARHAPVAVAVYALEHVLELRPPTLAESVKLREGNPLVRVCVHARKRRGQLLRRDGDASLPQAVAHLLRLKGSTPAAQVHSSSWKARMKNNDSNGLECFREKKKGGHLLHALGKGGAAPRS
jgi:hypothetical protein